MRWGGCGGFLGNFGKRKIIQAKKNLMSFISKSDSEHAIKLYHLQFVSIGASEEFSKDHT